MEERGISWERSVDGRDDDAHAGHGSLLPAPPTAHQDSNGVPPVPSIPPHLDGAAQHGGPGRKRCYLVAMPSIPGGRPVTVPIEVSVPSCSTRNSSTVLVSPVSA